MRILFTTIGKLAAVLALVCAATTAGRASDPPQFHVVPQDTDASPASDDSPSPNPNATPDPNLLTDTIPLDANDVKPVAEARAWFARLQTGTIDRTQLTATLNDALTDAAITQTSARLGPFGDPQTFFAGGKFVHNGITTYVFRVSWPAGAVLYQFALEDATGKVAALFTRPASPPRTR